MTTPLSAGAGTPPAVVVLGSLNADLVVATERFPGPGETVHGSDLRVGPGGKSANQAVAAALLGTPTAMVGAVGDDAHGDLVEQSLTRAGVATDHVLRLPDVPTGTALITVDRDGENTIVVSAGANGRLAPETVEEPLRTLAAAGATWLCLCLEVPVDTVARAVELGRELGLSVVLNPSPYAEVPAGVLACVDVLVVNEHEAALLVPGWSVDDPDGLLAALGESSVGRAVITRGAAGALVLDGGRATAVPAPAVRPVDTTGAGDAFTGALTGRLAAGASLTEAAEFAARVGAYATRTAGTQASYPTSADLQDWTHRRDGTACAVTPLDGT